jgi:hypothetical protein
VQDIKRYKLLARGELINGNTCVLYFDFKVEFGYVGVLVGVLFVCVQKSTGTTPMQLVLCLHYTLQKVRRHVKVKYGLLCMCGGWHNSSKHSEQQTWRIQENPLVQKFRAMLLPTGGLLWYKIIPNRNLRELVNMFCFRLAS